MGNCSALADETTDSTPVPSLVVRSLSVYKCMHILRRLNLCQTVHGGAEEARGTRSTSLRRTSYVRHQSAAGAAGRLTMDQKGLFDGVLVDAIGGEQDDGVDVSTSFELCRLACVRRFNFLTSIACGLTLDARS